MKMIGFAVCSALFFLSSPVSVYADTGAASDAESAYESEVLESFDDETGEDVEDFLEELEDEDDRMNVRTIYTGGDEDDLESMISVSCDHTDIVSYLDSFQNLITVINVLLGIQVGCICAMIFSIFWRY